MSTFTHAKVLEEHGIDEKLFILCWGENLLVKFKRDNLVSYMYDSVRALDECTIWLGLEYFSTQSNFFGSWYIFFKNQPNPTQFLGRCWDHFVKSNNILKVFH